MIIGKPFAEIHPLIEPANGLFGQTLRQVVPQQPKEAFRPSNAVVWQTLRSAARLWEAALKTPQTAQSGAVCVFIRPNPFCILPL